MKFSSVPWKHGTLPPKVKEFIYIAIDAATTHLYDPASGSTSATPSNMERPLRRSWRFSSS